MNILSKSAMTGAVAVLLSAAAFTTVTSTSAEARPKAHFRHAIHHCHTQSNHPYRCFNRVYKHVQKRALRQGNGIGYASNYNFVNYCGWNVTTLKKWNAAHTKLTIVKNRVWTCY